MHPLDSVSEMIWGLSSGTRMAPVAWVRVDPGPRIGQVLVFLKPAQPHPSHRPCRASNWSSSDGKVSDCNAGDLGSSPRSGRSPGEGNSNPLQYSCLENPMDGGT